MEPSTATSFVEGIRLGSNWAWRRLSAEYGPPIYADCRRAGFTADEAEDVTQESLLRIARKIDHFEPGSFRGWMRVIVRREQIEARRRAARQLASAVGGSDQVGLLSQVQSLEPPSEGATSGEIPPIDAELARVLAEVKAACKPQTWQVFVKQVVEGCTAKEAAEACGVTTGNAHVIRHRIIRRLRQQFDEEAARPGGEAS